jgi:hypothetical protein
VLAKVNSIFLLPFIINHHNSIQNHIKMSLIQTFTSKPASNTTSLNLYQVYINNLQTYLTDSHISQTNSHASITNSEPSFTHSYTLYKLIPHHFHFIHTHFFELSTNSLQTFHKSYGQDGLSSFWVDWSFLGVWAL